MPELTYATHRRRHPLFHFFILPVLSIQPLVLLVMLIRFRQPMMAWGVIVSVAVLSLAVTVRNYANRLQDRMIRLEETARLNRVLPPELSSRIGELTLGHIIALRFSSDEELPELVSAVLRGELKGREDIKARIKTWRPDPLRV